jgi:hypothetical protein
MGARRRGYHNATHVSRRQLSVGGATLSMTSTLHPPVSFRPSCSCRAVIKDAPFGSGAAVIDADTFFAQELLAARAWSFARADAMRITVRFLRCWAPKATRLDLRQGPLRVYLRSGRNCCSIGCRTPSRSYCRTQRTSCTCKTPAVWPRRSPDFSSGTRLRAPALDSRLAMLDHRDGSKLPRAPCQ